MIDMEDSSTHCYMEHHDRKLHERPLEQGA